MLLQPVLKHLRNVLTCMLYEGSVMATTAPPTQVTPTQESEHGLLLACQVESADGHVEAMTDNLTDNKAARMVGSNEAGIGGGINGGGGLRPGGGGCGNGGVGGCGGGGEGDGLVGGGEGRGGGGGGSGGDGGGSGGG